MKGPVSQYPCQPLFFFLIAILVGLNWYVVALNSISLMTNDVEHPFVCLFAIWISSLGKYLFRSYVHFLLGIFVVAVLLLKKFIYFTSYLTYSHDIFYF